MRFVYVIAVLKEGEIDYYAKFRNDRLSKPFTDGPTVFESIEQANSARAREKFNRFRKDVDKIVKLDYVFIPILIQSSMNIKKVKQLLACRSDELPQGIWVKQFETKEM